MKGKRRLLAVAAAVLVAVGVSAAYGAWAASILVALVGIAAMAVAGARGAAESRDSLQEEMHPADWARLAPIRKHREAIRNLVETKRNEPAIAVVGAEALAEADRILAQAARMVSLRRDLIRAASGRTEAQHDLADLDREIAEAATEDERNSLRSALEARQREVAHYDQAEAAKDRVETGLRQAEAALAEMKARLTTAAASAGGHQEDELRETIGRLKSLGTSLDEAEAWLKG